MMIFSGFRRLVIFLGALSFLMNVSPWVVASEASSVSAPSSDRAAFIVNMVKQDCGSCHGLTLRGGLGPALTTEALRDKPDALLVDTILQGRMNTAMPPWNRFLTQDEAVWVVQSLKLGSFQ